MVHATLRPGPPLVLPGPSLAETDDHDDFVLPSSRRHGRQGRDHEGKFPMMTLTTLVAKGFAPHRAPRFSIPSSRQKWGWDMIRKLQSAKIILWQQPPARLFFSTSPEKQLDEKKRHGNNQGGGSNQVGVKDDFPLTTRMKTNAFFAPLLAPFLNDKHGKTDHSRPNPNDINRHIVTDVNAAGIFASLYAPMVCHPDDPIEVGCVDSAYDTRVVYDKLRGVFWIEAALRDKVWVSSDCGNHACAPLATGIPHRFIAVAVSVSEDPRDGFNEFVLVDEYGDWPRIAVHGPFLILSHNDKQNVYLFDADRLAKNDFNNGLIGLGTFF